MDGIHDIGGMHGLGRIVTEENEPPFHTPWEGRMHGIAITCQVSGINTTPEQRKTIENMGATAYLNTSYYEKWLYAYETMLIEKGVITKAELDGRVASQADVKMVEHPQFPVSPSGYAEKVKYIIYNGTPHDRPTDKAPLFKVGDRVRAKNNHPTSHTRLPGFTKGKVGVVEAHHGAHCHHEALATGLGEIPDHLYAVKFTGPELWGPDGATNDAVYVDLFESYLEPVA